MTLLFSHAFDERGGEPSHDQDTPTFPTRPGHSRSSLRGTCFVVAPFRRCSIGCGSTMRHPYRKTGLAEVLAVVLTLGAPRIAFADDDAVTRAAVLSREAEKLMKDGKIAEACDKYEQSQSLDPRGETQLD